MSKDIRSYFQIKKPPAKPKIEDDDDVIPDSPDVHIKNKKKESRKKRVICDDSDEEIFSSKKHKSSHVSSSSEKPKNKKAELKEVKASDIFGSAPIKRTEALVKKEKKKTETGIHSDDEFEKSLLEVDAIEEEATKKEKETKTKELEVKKESPQKVNGDAEQTHSKSKPKLHEHNLKKEVKKEETLKKERPVFSEFIEDSQESKDMDKKKGTEKKKVKLDKSNDSEKKKEDKSPKKDRKRDFSEFSGNDSTMDAETPKSKKKKMDKSLNESVLTDEERHERKMHSAALYQKYLNRSGPKHLGAKQIPEGSPDCLRDCAFLLTGVLDSFERDEIVAAVQKYGGSIKNTMSKKVTHVLAGEDAGPAKMAKAQELGIKIIGEDEFLQMIKDGSHKKKTEKQDSKRDIKKEKSPHRTHKDKKTDIKESRKDRDRSQEKKHHDKNHTSKAHTEKESSRKYDKDATKNHEKEKINHEIKIETRTDLKTEEAKSSDSVQLSVKSESSTSFVPSNALMWVDKYKPQNTKQIIGQHGDASNVKKLMNWLTKWYTNRKAKLPKPSPWAKNDDGGFYKAALLSGPPGVGKTTTVALVCKELGFDTVEFNASDTRNKTMIKEQIGELLTTTSLSGYAMGSTGKQAVSKKHVLVMDEVDGMAGNEDRGGLQELIALIKSTAVPIICMCNDRNNQKMRSLVNYCYDLRFNRPRVEQIKSAMMSICCKEGIKIPPDALSQLIVASNQDVRQTLNLLSMWAVDPDLTDSDRLKKDALKVKKDLKLGPWEAIRKVFTAEEHKTMSISDKSDLFFYDYSLAPLFVQENYLQVVPHCPKQEILERFSKAADSISLGDLVDARIRRNQAWNLLPVQAMYASVIPGHALAGHVAGQIQFPGWLGKNSRAGKMQRLAQEIHAHTRLSTSGSKSSIFLDYCTYLRDAILNPLLKDKAEGIDKSLEVLESYHLLRDDLDSLTELSLWPGQRNPMILIDSKVKAAMTRTYNKKAMALPYAPGSVKRCRQREDEENEDNEEDSPEDPEDSDPENDALIKKKKVEKASSSKEKAGSSKEKSSSSKGSKEKKKK